MNKSRKQISFERYIFSKYISIPQEKMRSEVNECTLDEIVDDVFNKISIYFIDFKIFNSEFMKVTFKNYIYYRFFMEAIIRTEYEKNSVVNKLKFTKTYLMKNEDDEKSAYKYLNRYLEKEGIDKFINYQRPFHAYSIIRRRSLEGREKKVFKLISSRKYNKLKMEELKYFYYDILNFTDKFEEKYKNISKYLIEYNYSYLTIIEIIEFIKSLNIEREDVFFDILYDILIIFDCPDINFRIDSLKLFDISKRNFFMEEITYVNTVLFKLADYYIHIMINRIDIKKLKEVIKSSDFSNYEIFNKHESKLSDDKDIYTNEEILRLIGDLVLDSGRMLNIKDVIALIFQYEKDSYSVLGDGVVDKDYLVEYVKFLDMINLYNKNTIKEEYISEDI